MQASLEQKLGRWKLIARLTNLWDIRLRAVQRVGFVYIFPKGSHKLAHWVVAAQVARGGQSVCFLTVNPLHTYMSELYYGKADH